MSLEIHFDNNIPDWKKSFEQAISKSLEEIGLTGESYAAQACPVDTGNLRGSISHEVDTSEKAAYIGTNCEYAPYVELGTGVYATMGGGRNTPWCYQDAKGNWHYTNGQQAQPYLKPAVADHGDTYRNIIESEMRNG